MCLCEDLPRRGSKKMCQKGRSAVAPRPCNTPLFGFRAWGLPFRVSGSRIRFRRGLWDSVGHERSFQILVTCTIPLEGLIAKIQRVLQELAFQSQPGAATMSDATHFSKKTKSIQNLDTLYSPKPLKREPVPKVSGCRPLVGERPGSRDHALREGP